MNSRLTPPSGGADGMVLEDVQGRPGMRGMESHEVGICGHFTMARCDNPVFVEGMVREVAAALRNNPLAASCSIEAVNDESGHNHAAFARITRAVVSAPASGEPRAS